MSRNGKIILVTLAVLTGLAAALLLDGFGHLAEARLAPTAPGAPRRMAVFSGTAVEILFALGAEDRIVGTSRYAAYPPAATKLPKLGGIMDINFERLTALSPDVIAAQSTPNSRIARFAKERHIDFWRLEIETIEDVFSVIDLLGKRLRLSAESIRVSETLRRDLNSIASRTATLPKVPCFISVDRSPGQLSQILSAGGGTFLSELVAIAGGRNIFDDMDTGYAAVSKEALTARAPAVILEMKPGTESSDICARMTDDWQALPRIPAVSAGRIAVITHAAALLPSLRMAAVVKEMARALHPEAFVNDEATR